MVKTRFSIFMLLCLLGSSISLHGSQPCSQVKVGAVFIGKAPLHEFVGRVCTDCVQVSNCQGELSDLYVTIPVRKINTGIYLRNKNMYDMFNEKCYPYILGYFHNINLNQVGCDPCNDDIISFQLTIRDVTRTINAQIQLLEDCPSYRRFALEFCVSCKSFYLQPPGIGPMQVQDRIFVRSYFTVMKS